MKHLQPSSAALAAALDDGSAVTWAMLRLGRIASLYKSSWQIRNTSILPLVCSLPFRMTALLRPGASLGGDCSENVKPHPVILCSARCHLAGCDRGDASFGTGCVSVQEQLSSGQRIHSSTGVFALFLGNSSVVMWAFLSTAVIPAMVRDSW